MSKKMSKAPLYHALAQAQFNPIAAMENYINKIQDKFRLEGYTLFESQKITQLHFNTDSSPIPKADVIELPVWRITRPDRSAGFILGQSFLAFHTTNYQTHKQFFDEFLMGLQIIHSITHLEHLSKLGLRYLNAVLPQKNETVNQYLGSGLHGMHFDETPRYSLIESVFDTNQGTLVSRVHHRKGPVGYPPDMAPSELVSLPQFADKGNISHAVIDIDHFTENQIPINWEQVKSSLTFLHKGIADAFHSTITNHARERWS
jgi:uncharacterized protein (TIGR04255 family)